MMGKRIFIMVVVLFLDGCGPKEESVNSAEGEAFGLDNCDESFTSDVSDFYTTYFSCVDISVSNLSTIIESNNLPPYD